MTTDSLTAKKPFLSSFLFAALYGIGFYMIQFFLAHTQMVGAEPNAHNIASWDSGFYESIAQAGYAAGEQKNGFFILFPLVWRLSHLGVWGITFLNIGFFALGFAFLMKALKETDKVFWLLCLTIPSVYFAFLPYTESLFFLLGSLSIYAIKEKKLWLIFTSLLLISMVRATAVFFLPALFITELFSNPIKEWLRSSWRFLYKYALPCILGLSIFIVYQYVATGIWFVYFKTQSTVWAHAFSLPGIPFCNIENGTTRFHWLSALALFLDLVAAFFVIKMAIQWFKNKTENDSALIFSLGYLAMALVFLITFNPKYESHTSNIMGANRYTFITPFCFYFLHHLLQLSISKKQVIISMVVAAGFWQLFHSYVDVDHFIRIGMMPTLILFSFLWYIATGRKSTWLIIAIIAFHFMTQLHFFQQFITPLYMD